MAMYGNNSAGNPAAPKKADVILKCEQEISYKQDELIRQIGIISANVREVTEKLSKSVSDSDFICKQNSEIYIKLKSENESLKQELLYLAKQNENIYSALSENISSLSDRLESLSEKVDSVQTQTAELCARAEEEPEEVAEEPVAEEEPVEEELAEEVQPAPVAIDYDRLAIDYEKLAAAVAEKLTGLRTEVDYDKIADMTSVKEYVSPDYIASKVAEQIVIPAVGDVNVDEGRIAELVSEKVNIDEEKIASLVSEKITVDEEKIAALVSEKVSVDEEKIARLVSEKLVAEPVQDKSQTVVEEPVSQTAESPAPAAAVVAAAMPVDEDEIADKIALKVGSLKSEDFEILVDDEGCASVAKEIAEKLDYDAICAALAEKLKAAEDGTETEEPDYEEMARHIAEKINVPQIDEAALADKAAAALSNYLPDNDELADKITSSVMEALSAQPAPDNDELVEKIKTAVNEALAAQPSVDSATVCDTISDRLIQSQADRDYDIVIDDEGISKITGLVSEEIEKETGARFEEANARFDKIDEDIRELKVLLASGAVVTAGEIAASSAACEEQEDELVTVSALVENDGEESTEEFTESNPGDDEPAQENDVIEELDEQLSEGEIMPDGLAGESGGVDFVNMMKYDRSFIARIIQSSDEQKGYYGQVKQALLSYKKVNSNIAWGSERFNKGRETIARFKIRGKTLCLYLALDPNEYPVSVYHHADVSDNKSMHGTPMMVKIKSPRGAKKAIRLIDELLAKRDGVKIKVPERDYAAMYPYETMEELIADGLVKDVSKK